jgi:hypothetical protein
MVNGTAAAAAASGGEDEDPIVPLLRAVLARAERGEFAGVAVAAVNSDDLSAGSTWAVDGITMSELIGAAAVLNARMIAAVMAETVPVARRA